MQEGWISVHRQVTEHWLWQDKPFSYGQAWIDLLMMANHKDNKTLLNGDLITVERGGLITSELKLSDRWGWSRTKLRRFLSLLENDNMIVIKKDNKKTAINIVNYCIYNNSETTKRQQKNIKKTSEEQQKNIKKTSEEQQKNTNNNVNNDNNVNNVNNENNVNKKHIYGEYKHVRLSDRDMELLQNDYEQEVITRAIKILDEYIEIKNPKYKNHYLVMRKWVLDRAKEELSGNKQYYYSNIKQQVTFADIMNMDIGE